MKISALLLCAALGGCHSAGSRAAAPNAAAPVAPLASVSAEAPAPFVFTLQGPATPPSQAGALRLVAQIDRPHAAGALPIDLEVVTPPGVALAGDPAQQRLTLDAGQLTLLRPLSFTLSGPLSAPIVVRASFRFGDAMGASAERIYPAPPDISPADPDGTAGGGKTRNLGMIPVGTPVPAVPSN